MARAFASASSQYVTDAPAQLFSAKASLSAWVRFATLPGGSAWFTIYSRSPTSGGADIRNFAIDLQGAASNPRQLRVAWTSGGSGSYVVYENNWSLSASTWYHILFSCDWSTNPDTIACYIDGSSVSLSRSAGTNNASPDSSGSPQANWGRLLQSGGSASAYLNGDLAECALWTDALSADDAAALARGVAPILVKPASICNYAPFLGGVNDRVLGALTNNSTTASDHPPKIIYPNFGRRIYVPASASATGSLSATLGTLTLSSAGTVAIAGALSQTLGTLTISATGTVADGPNGELAQTLAALTLSSAGAVAIAGAASNTLGTLTLSGAGTVAVTGAVSVTLDALTLVAAQSTSSTTGALAKTLGTLTLSAAGAAPLVWVPTTPAGGSWTEQTPAASSWTRVLH